MKSEYTSFLVVPFLMLQSTLCSGAYIYGAETTITGVASYGMGAVTGDVRITVKDTVTGCEAGYYVTDNNAGKSEILSIALSAFHAGSKVKINGTDTPRWEGSPHNYCGIEGIHLSK